jgi:2-polyprenyl-6-methoxyphenol hydroxylase-like FAD-dependent oxidoreductase
MGDERTATVVGAGIGGLAAGIALRRSGWDVTVYEAAAEPRQLGSGLSIWPNAVRALRALGLGGLADDAITQSGGVRRADGSLLAGFEEGVIEARFGEPLLGVHRGDLLAALLVACGHERVRFGKRASGIEGRELRFEDGDTARADLIVGADGLGSVVRRGLLGDGEPRDAGIVAYRGVAEFEGELPAGEWWGPGSVAGLLPLQGGRVYWYFGVRGEDGPGVLDELIDSYDPAVGEIVRLTPVEEVLVHKLYDRDPVKSWSRGEATLLGDAAHPMLPFIGQGACSALEDAVVLAAALADAPDVSAGLVAYERARIERAELFVHTSRRAAAIALPRSALGRGLRNSFLRLLPESARLRQFKPFLEWQVPGQAGRS